MERAKLTPERTVTIDGIELKLPEPNASIVSRGLKKLRDQVVSLTSERDTLTRQGGGAMAKQVKDSTFTDADLDKRVAERQVLVSQAQKVLAQHVAARRQAHHRHPPRGGRRQARRRGGQGHDRRRHRGRVHRRHRHATPPAARASLRSHLPSPASAPAPSPMPRRRGRSAASSCARRGRPTTARWCQQLTATSPVGKE